MSDCNNDYILVWFVCLMPNQILMGYLMLKFHEVLFLCLMTYPYLPIPPLGQDMTQGQFLSGV